MALWNVVDGLSIFHRLFWLICMSRCAGRRDVADACYSRRPAVVFNYLCGCLLTRLLFYRLFFFGCLVLAYFIVWQYIAAAACRRHYRRYAAVCPRPPLPPRPSVRPSKEQSSNDKNEKKQKKMRPFLHRE